MKFIVGMIAGFIIAELVTVAVIDRYGGFHTFNGEYNCTLIEEK